MDRLLLDFARFLAHHTVLAFALFCGLAYLAVLVLRKRTPVHEFVCRHARLIAATTGLGLAAIFALIGIWYLRVPGFAGEVEPLISSISWLVQKGQPLYHDLHAAERYSVLYGPSVFLTNGLFLEILGPSLWVAKLASFLSAISSVIFFYLSLARRRVDITAIGMVGVLVMYYWAHGFSVYLVRPDSMILAALSFGLFCAVRTRRGLSILAVAAALGFAVNLKVHAGLYFLPILGILADRWNWRTAMTSVGIAVIVVLAPFVIFPQVSLWNYVGWLANATKHGMTTETLVMTTRFAIFLFLPLLVLRVTHLSAPLKVRTTNLDSMLLPAALAALLLSNKPGAGLVHLLPLVPPVLYRTGLAARGVRLRLRSHPLPRRGTSLVVALLATVLLSGSVLEYQSVRMVQSFTGDSNDLCDDLERIMSDNDGLKIAMACGGEDSSFRKTWMRPLLVFQDNPLFLDPIAVMDCQLSGLDFSSETYTAMANGNVDLWLVPRHNEPFVKQNWYPPHAPIFNRRFLQNFHANYSRTESSEYFDLWYWNGLGPDSRHARVVEPAVAVESGDEKSER